MAAWSRAAAVAQVELHLQHCLRDLALQHQGPHPLSIWPPAISQMRSSSPAAKRCPWRLTHARRASSGNRKDAEAGLEPLPAVADNCQNQVPA